MLSALKGTQMRLSDLTPKQTEAVTFCFERDEGILMVPMGFGKTVVSHTAAQELLAESAVCRVLVVAPLRVCNEVWAHEWRKWEHLDEIGMATGDAAQRVAVIEGDRRIVCINFEVLPWLFERYPSAFDGLIVDELTKFKAGGVQFKALRKHLKHFNWRLGMTGTLAEEGLEGLFYQTMAIDKGKIFGKNKKKWLRKYFLPTDYEEYNWEVQPGGSELIAAALAPLIFESKVDGGKPMLRHDVVELDMPKLARAVYSEMCKEHLVGDVEAVNAAVLSGKLEQIASGFLYGGDELHSEKQIALINADEGEQMVVAYRYTHDLAVLREIFPEGRELRDDSGIVADFNSGKLRVLFLHPASGGHGLNLQLGGCYRVLFFGPIWSRDQTDQLIGRVCRRGNPAAVVWVTTFVMKGTVESEVMLPRLAGKGEVAALFADHLQAVNDH